MTRKLPAFDVFVARIERQRGGVDRELKARRAGLAGSSWGVLRLTAIVIWSSKTVSSFWAELRSGVCATFELALNGRG